MKSEKKLATAKKQWTETRAALDAAQMARSAAQTAHAEAAERLMRLMDAQDD